MSITISASLSPIFLVVLIKWWKLHGQTWGGWSSECLTDWGQFLRLGLPGFLVLAFQWWSYEISAIVTDSIDETQLAINAVLTQCGILLSMVSIPYLQLYQSPTLTGAMVFKCLYSIFHSLFELGF